MRLTEVVNRGDIRVIDPARVGRLTVESADRLTVARHRGVQHLDRALPAHLHVLGEVHTSHAARAEVL